MSRDFFSGRTAIIVTKHEKEKAIAPVLGSRLNLTCLPFTQFDTDLLGTFTGEKERLLDVKDVLRQKCYAGLDQSSFEIVIASEGSFFTHPYLWFQQCDDENILIIDRKNGIEIMVHEMSTETNHAYRIVDQWDELYRFAVASGFPEHGLILRPAKNSYQQQEKGIHDLALLKKAFENIRALFGTVYVETDMRASHNPMRMKVIQKAAHKLCDTISSLCPICQWPGFTSVDYKTGLPCRECDYPTQSILSVIHKCQNCQYTDERFHPKGKKWEDPQYCDQCNP